MVSAYAQAFDVMKEADPKYFGEEGDKISS